MVAKSLDDNKPKIHLKIEFALFQKRKRKFLYCVHLVHEAGSWNYEVSYRSHVTMAKKLDVRAKLLFC